ncbi:MAG: hypothetical protein ACE5G9_13330 [Nitrospinales bacterium]
MSGLKSAWELSLEKSDRLDPELKKRKKLTDAQKAEIAEIRKEYRAKIADKDVAVQHRIRKLSDRVPPDRIEMEAETLRNEFAEEKRLLEKEMESEVEAVHNRNR